MGNLAINTFFWVLEQKTIKVGQSGDTFFLYAPSEAIVGSATLNKYQIRRLTQICQRLSIPIFDVKDLK